MNLDFATGVVVLWMATAFSIIHVLSSPKRGHWMQLPAYVRATILPTAAVCVFRGVDLINFGIHPEIIAIGHANGLAFLTSFALATVCDACLFYILARTYPPEVWTRVRLIKCLFRKSRAQLDDSERQAVEGVLEGEKLINVLSANGLWVYPPAGRHPR